MFPNLGKNTFNPTFFSEREFVITEMEFLLVRWNQRMYLSPVYSKYDSNWSEMPQILLQPHMSTVLRQLLKKLNPRRIMVHSTLLEI